MDAALVHLAALPDLRYLDLSTLRPWSVGGEGVQHLAALPPLTRLHLPYGATLLYMAAEHGHLEVVRALLEAGADLNQANTDGDTPLCIAAQCGRKEVVRALLEAGAERRDDIDYDNL